MNRPEPMKTTENTSGKGSKRLTGEDRRAHSKFRKLRQHRRLILS